MSRTDIIEKKFCQRLNDLMNKKGINQKDLADELGFSRKSINEYVNGKSCPSRKRLQEIAMFFGVFEEYLSGKSDYKNAGDLADKQIGDDFDQLSRHIRMIEYFDEKFGLNDYDHGEMTILKSHTETEIIDGKVVEVQCIDGFEDDYTRLLRDIEEYVIFKTNQFKRTHSKTSRTRREKKERDKRFTKGKK